MHLVVKLVFCVALCYGQTFNVQDPLDNNTGLHNDLSERIGNFSIEVLYHTSKTLVNGQNFIMSPITVWSVMAVISEGAAGTTRQEINNALRLSVRDRDRTRIGFKNITQWLQVNTNTVQLAKMNAIFMDSDRLALPDFRETAKSFYQTEMVTLNFKDSVNSAYSVNQAISNLTRGKIPNMVDASYFQDTQLMLASALYFKGQWTVPFNATFTTRMPFFDSNGNRIGEVNMMSNRNNYPFANIHQLQARVIELPYGNENRLSMLIMLPNKGVSLEDMFSNFKNVNLDTLFQELRVAKEQYSEDQVDCFIPRFKIQSDLDLSNVMREQFGISELFDASRALLPHMARTPVYVSRLIHKAEIEVTEDGTEAAGVTVAEFSNRIGVVQFQANRPFTYVIVEKVTNSIVFGGFYRQPSVY